MKKATAMDGLPSSAGAGLKRTGSSPWPMTTRRAKIFSKRLIQNTAVDPKASGDVARKLGVKMGAMTAYRFGKFIVKAGALYGMAQAWNYGARGDDERSLTPEKRSTPHITFGKDSTGEVWTFDRIGSVTDFLEWFGMDAPQYLVSEYMSGRKNLKDIAEYMAWSPVNKIAQGSFPFIKQAGEVASEKAYYPKIQEPRRIRDKMEYLFNSYGLGTLYKAFAGKPMKSTAKEIGKFFAYSMNPEEGSYFHVNDLKRDFKKSKGDDSRSFFDSRRSRHLYNFKLAVRYKDFDAMAKYLDLYREADGNQEGIRNSQKRMDPLYGIKEEEMEEFLQYIGADGRESLEKAKGFYEDMLIMSEPYVEELPRKKRGRGRPR